MSDEKTEIAKAPKTIVDKVLAKVNKFEELGQLQLHKDYSPANALKSAHLMLMEMTCGPKGNKKKVLEATTPVSQANALFEMIVQGLNPMKKQGSFITYGNELQWQKEYAGNIAIAKRDGEVKDVRAEVIYQKDVFEFSIDKHGKKNLTKHETSLDNLDTAAIKGAYCILTLNDGSTIMDVMNYHQIKTAWNQGPNKGDSPAHRNFPDQMCKKTVINRTCKLVINTTSDGNLMTENTNPSKAEAAKDEAVDNNAIEDVEFTPVDETPETIDETPQQPDETPPVVESVDGVEPIKPLF